MRQRLRCCLLTALLVTASALARAEASAEAPSESAVPPDAAALLQAFAAGDYATVALDGERRLALTPNDHRLRLAVADSLSWTGHAWAATAHYRQLVELNEEMPRAQLELARNLSWTARTGEAIEQFLPLLDGPLAAEARAGLAHAYRWHGRDDKALPLYRAGVPDDAARLGQGLAERKLATRTRLTLDGEADSTDLSWRATTLRQDWRGGDGAASYALRVQSGRMDEDTLASTRRIDYRAAAVEMAQRDWPLAPALELGRRVEPEARGFGQLRLSMPGAPLNLTLARLDWGRQSFSARALERGLMARHWQLDANLPTALGGMRLNGGAIDIDDGNRIRRAEFRLTPWARPFGPNVRPYLGVGWRAADREVGEYWSPVSYKTGFVGAEIESFGSHHEISGFLQMAPEFGGGHTLAWSGGGEAKRWLSQDFALGLRLLGQRNGQGSGYHAGSGSLYAELLW